MFNLVKERFREKIIRFGTRIVLNGIEEYFCKNEMPKNVAMEALEEHFYKNIMPEWQKFENNIITSVYKENISEIQKRVLPNFLIKLDKTSFVGLPLTENTEENLNKYLIDAKCFDEQSMQYVIDCLPFFNEYCHNINLSKWNTYSLVDIGSRTGAGSNLLGTLYADWHYGEYQFIVDALDIDKDWVEYAKFFPNINSYRNDDIFNLSSDSYDICFCSHVIEHLDDPVTFVNKVTDISKYFSIFYCPYNEDNPISGHRTITDEIVNSCNPVWKKTVKSVHRWREDLEFIIFITSKN